MRKITIIEHISLDGVIQAPAARLLISLASPTQWGAPPTFRPPFDTLVTHGFL